MDGFLPRLWSWIGLFIYFPFNNFLLQVTSIQTRDIGKFKRERLCLVYGKEKKIVKEKDFLLFCFIM